MSKSGLRTQHEKRGRKIIVLLIILGCLGMVGYQVDRHYGLREYFSSFYNSFGSSFKNGGAKRGTIFDRNLKQLAVDRERVSVYVRTREISSVTAAAKELGSIFGIDEGRLVEQLESGVLRQWIARDISQEQEEALKERKLPGVYLQREVKRYYPHNNLAAHLLGYVKDGIGLSGVEFYYDRLLANRKKAQQEAQQPLSRAQDLVLTIDIKIQTLVDELIREIKEKGDLLKAAAYVLDGESGEIVAGAQVPDFNPNTFTQYPQDSFRNIFLSPLLVPEKFRLLVRDGAMLYHHSLEKLPVVPWSLVNDDSDLGSQLRLWEWLGLGDPVTTDFYSGGGGDQDDVHSFPVTQVRYPMGLIPEQTTPLNLLCGLCQMLGGGQKTRPYVIAKIVDIENGQEVQLKNGVGMLHHLEDSPKIAIPEINPLFRSLASRGPANSYLLSDGITVEERAATSSRILHNEVTFISLPAGDTPLGLMVVCQRELNSPALKRVSDTQLVEEIIREKLERIAILQQVATTVADVVEPEAVDEANYRGSGNTKLPDLQSHPKRQSESQTSLTMPNLVGLSLRRSLQLLQNVPVKISIQGSGRVVTQKPQPGTLIRPNDECVLVLEAKQIHPVDGSVPEKVQ